MYKNILYESKHSIDSITVENKHKISNLFLQGVFEQEYFNLATINPKTKKTLFFKTPFEGKIYASHNKFEIIELTQNRSLQKLLNSTSKSCFSKEPVVFDKKENQWFILGKDKKKKKVELKAIWKKVKFNLKKLYSK